MVTEDLWFPAITGGTGSQPVRNGLLGLAGLAGLGLIGYAVVAARRTRKGLDA